MALPLPGTLEGEAAPATLEAALLVVVTNPPLLSEKILLANSAGLTLKGGLGVASGLGEGPEWALAAACSNVLWNLFTNSENTGASEQQSRNDQQ